MELLSYQKNILGDIAGFLALLGKTGNLNQTSNRLRHQPHNAARPLRCNWGQNHK